VFRGVIVVVGWDCRIVMMRFCQKFNDAKTAVAARLNFPSTAAQYINAVEPVSRSAMIQTVSEVACIIVQIMDM
jgi:hypothetical protein